MHWTNLNYFLVPFWINSKTSNLNFLLWINQRNTVVDFINKCSAHCNNKKQRLMEDIKSYICLKNLIHEVCRHCVHQPKQNLPVFFTEFIHSRVHKTNLYIFLLIISFMLLVFSLYYISCLFLMSFTPMHSIIY